LGRLYEVAARMGDLGPDVAASLLRIYPGLPPDTGADGLDSATVVRHGLVLAREVIAVSRRYLVASEKDARLARIDARPSDTARIEVVPELELSTSSEGGGLSRLVASLLNQQAVTPAVADGGRP
ncbi:MAG: hypothetical protein J2O47_04260, partial [Acidimicrobiaceae bacterium]|nr:hypothetical protein [Acidimicrobiaceae bacterium]